MLTPELISVPSVRVKRDTADLRSTSPSTGNLQQRPVDLQLADGRRVVVLERRIRRRRRRRRSQDRRIRGGTPRRRSRCGSAAAAPVHRPEHVLEDRDDEDQQHGDGDGGDVMMTPGRSWRPSPCGSRASFFSMNVARRIRIVSRIPPASPAATMLTYSSLNALGMLAERVGHRVARLDVEHHRARHVLERLVLALLGEDVERLHQRQTRVDHRRELPGEDDDVAHLDAAAARLLALRLLVDLDDGQPLAPELRDDVVAGRRRRSSRS